MEEKKRLTRSNNKMIGGVCAGLAEYLDIDLTQSYGSYGY